MKKLNYRQHLLASTLLVGATALASPALAQDAQSTVPDRNKATNPADGQPTGPAEAAPPPQCTVTMPIVIYFGWDIDTPPPESDAVVAQTVQSMNTCGWHSLSLAGHADRSGSDRYNMALSQRRANNVAAKLTGAGLPGEAISVKAFGESSPAVQTPDGVREPLNRRVEITAQ